MKPKDALAIAVAMLGSVISCTVTASGQANEKATSVYVTKIPSGYRDWRVISVAHEEGNLHSFSVVLGNDVAIKAYREGKIPFPDGTVILALHYKHVPSEENNKVFGDEQSFVPGTPTNIQLEAKNSKDYAAAGGWAFGFFTDGKPVAEAKMKTCAPCHAKSPTDFVFARYAP